MLPAKCALTGSVYSAAKLQLRKQRTSSVTERVASTQNRSVGSHLAIQILMTTLREGFVIFETGSVFMYAKVSNRTLG